MSFQQKLVLWEEHCENGCLEIFPSSYDCVEENTVKISMETRLSEYYFYIFQMKSLREFWMPLLKTLKCIILKLVLQEYLIGISEERNLWDIF